MTYIFLYTQMELYTQRIDEPKNKNVSFQKNSNYKKFSNSIDR